MLMHLRDKPCNAPRVRKYKSILCRVRCFFICGNGEPRHHCSHSLVACMIWLSPMHKAVYQALTPSQDLAKASSDAAGKQDKRLVQPNSTPDLDEKASDMRL